MIKLTHLSNQAIKLNDDGSQQANSTYGFSYAAMHELYLFQLDKA